MNKQYNIIKKLYNNKNINNICDNIDITYSLNYNKTYLNNKCFGAKYSFNELISYINKCNYVCVIKSELSNIKFNIYYSKFSELNIIKFTKIYKRIIILSNLYNLNKIINFNIILSPFKRYFPNENEILDSRHINGGFTYLNSNDIFIIRKDECSKVMLHEFIHHIAIINDISFTNDEIIKLKYTFNLSKYLNLIPNESVVEFWATIYQIIFVSIDYDISYKLVLDKEIGHSISLCNRLLNNNKKYWYEETNAYSYIVFKLIFLLNYNKFLNIYTLPYSSSSITNFLIKNKKTIDKNSNIINYNKNSLNLMIFGSY